MPKNVIILEGGKGLRFADVSKLITDKADGNDSWVPTEDRIIRQKYISENGIYYAKDDGIYGFSKLTVNIPGGAQGYTVPTVASLPYGVEVATTDPSQPMPIIPGTVGSSLIGIDPDTGLRSVATVQPDGTLKKKVIPSAIRVLIPPAKITYTSGEKIQYAGLVVELLDSNGNNFQDDRFPEGIIPWSPVKNLLDDSKNLITPMTNAPDASGMSISSLEGTGAYDDIETPLNYSLTRNVRIDYLMGGGKGVHMATVDTPVFAIAYYGSVSTSYSNKANVGFILASDKAFEYRYNRGTEQNPNWVTYSAGKATKNNKDFYYGGMWSSAMSGSITTSNVPINTMKKLYNEFSPSDVAYELVYNDSARSKGDVPVQWKSPYDGQTYEDKFKIEVIDSESASNEGGSSEGGSSEGGGGGHSF